MPWFRDKSAAEDGEMPGTLQKTLLIGMSHVEAVQRAINERTDAPVKVVALNTSPKIWDMKNNTLALSHLKMPSPKHVFASLGGNFHTIFGLIENPQPIAIASDNGAYSYSTEGRTLIPREMIKDHFRIRVMNLLQHLATIKAHFPDATIHHICSPPPIYDEEHILKYPGVFRPRLHQGITPAALRLTFYNLHCEVYQEHCAKLSVNFIAPPSEAIDENGFLGSNFVNTDPTHGNTQYGALVLNQIMKTLEQDDG